jgi:predicted dehydrogenase
MLKQEDLDLVIICTPDFLHVEQGIQAAEAGKHLIIEKAIALNLKDLRALQSAVNQARIKTVVSFVLRWNPMINLSDLFWLKML